MTTHPESTIKLTQLRTDVLSILKTTKKPLGAYEILSKLKKKRSSAEPPTVYRVLDYLTSVHLVHRIDSQNLYVACVQDSHLLTTILLFCNLCQHSFEFQDKNLTAALSKFSKRNSLGLDKNIIEIKGTCSSCITK